MAELTAPIHQTQILTALFSPAFPIGSFSYSHGIEAAIHASAINDVRTAHDWIETCLIGGNGRNDAILMANAYRAVNGHMVENGLLAGAKNAKIEAINELAFALSSGAERAQESRELGAGLVVRYLGCDLTLGLTFFLQSFIANLISVVVRAVPLGQSDGQIMLAQMMPAVATLANEAALAPLDDVGGYAILADHASILHETLEPRIYRT